MLFPCAKQRYNQNENPCLPPEENAVVFKMQSKNCHGQRSQGLFLFF